MKKTNIPLDKVKIYSRLVKEGFTLGTLLKCSNTQLTQLATKVLKEDTVADLTREKASYMEDLADAQKNIADANEDIVDAQEQQAEETGVTMSVAATVSEEEELTPNNEPVVNYEKDGAQQTLLGSGDMNEFDMYETIMYGGAGDFDDTSFYNPDAGGFHSSQGPFDSYYSTDNKEEMVGAGTTQDHGQYTGNAKYLDTPSFNNPDASGFDSEGPTDSYAGNGYDEGGFAGELNEIVAGEYDSFYNEHKRGFKSDGPRGHSSGLHEDEDYLNALAGEKLYGQGIPHDADNPSPDGMADDTDPDSPAHKYMGDIAETLTKKELEEVAVSKKQFNFYQMVKACKESGYKDCGDGRNNNEIKNTAKDMSLKQINDYTETTNPEKLPTSAPKTEAVNRKMVENWLMGLVEKYERPSMSKKRLLQTLNEIAVMNSPAPAPVKTPTRTKPGTTPKRRKGSPYNPKPGPKPNPKAGNTDSDIEDAKHELPSWLDFESLFTNHETNA